MSDSKRPKTSRTYVGVVYIYNETRRKPQRMITVTEAEMETEHWLVDTLVSLFPGMNEFAWNGAHILLTWSDMFNMINYTPLQPWGRYPDMREFTSDDIYEAFQAHPIYKKLGNQSQLPV